MQLSPLSTKDKASKKTPFFKNGQCLFFDNVSVIIAYTYCRSHHISLYSTRVIVLSFQVCSWVARPKLSKCKVTNVGCSLLPALRPLKVRVLAIRKAKVRVRIVKLFVIQ